MGVAHSYAQVASLEDGPLRVLLRTGEPFERVWAAWSLALRLGIQFAKELEVPSRAEPNPGVRRHLAVVLAGAAQRDALAAMAVGDPDEDVRATAAQLILQTAKEPDVAASVEMLVDLAKNDAAPQVRERVFELLVGRWPHSRLDVALTGLQTPQESVRRAACAVVLSRDVLEQTASAVLEYALNESSEHLRRTVLPRAVTKPSSRKHSREHGASISMTCLTRSKEKTSPSVGPKSHRSLASNLLADHASAEFSFLLSRASRAYGETPPTREGHLAAQVGRLALEALVARGDRPTPTASQRQLIMQLVADLEAQLHELDPDWFLDEDEHEFLSNQRDRMRQLLG